jgi:outer membrane protein assembly factor BamB
MPSWSGATPILVGERIFVMSPSGVDAEELKKAEEERLRREQQGGRGRRSGRHAGGQELQLLCLDKEQGSVLWTRTLDSGNRLHMKGNETSPSPVSDGEHVWAVTGSGKVSALDLEGKVVWQRDVQADYGKFGHNWGYACSPLLHDGLLVLEVLHGTHTDEPSYVVALDALTGETKWRVERPTDAPQESPDAYTTPLLVQHAGQTQIVISGGDCVTGHELATGKELWRVDALNPRDAGNYRIVASPLVVDGIVYAPTRVRPLTAIALGAEALPGEKDIAWQWDDRGGPDVPTPTCDGKYFYMIDDSGRATCLDAKTGALVWGPERTVEGTVSSSPLLAEGRIYFATEEGITVVLKAGAEFELLAANELDGSYTLSSPIASGDKLYVRTGAFLYCLGG